MSALGKLLASALRGPQRRAVHVEATLAKAGIVLPPPGKPKANYNMLCWAPNQMLYLSGHLPITTDGTLLVGRLGEGGMGVEQGYEHARWVGLNFLSTLQQELGDLDRVEKVVKLLGVVNSTNAFTDQHLVVNGCSDIFMQAFGPDVGYHARSAIAANTLPLGVSVEIEAIFKIKD
jgi:enamine deaminase RidA (YjgF/YER057c/UK114 family)